MQIATYVVVDPPDREVLLWRILKGIVEVTEIELTLEPLDSELPESSRKIGFAVRQSSHDGFNFHLFTGEAYEGSVKYTVNLSIPPWDEPTTVKIALYQEVS